MHLRKKCNYQFTNVTFMWTVHIFVLFQIQRLETYLTYNISKNNEKKLAKLFRN